MSRAPQWDLQASLLDPLHARSHHSLHVSTHSSESFGFVGFDCRAVEMLASACCAVCPQLACGAATMPAGAKPTFDTRNAVLIVEHNQAAARTAHRPRSRFRPGRVAISQSAKERTHQGLPPALEAEVYLGANELESNWLE
eukprot:CAMPEP_0204600408 /NCGR_PEP_ID=MMETSP0661-20131031/55427_1 /ASSEMBLY_ACC=CAM_ASM_000606 /TAXON_ID=109239 /ORGANISM="Alexandrium margalefi, Strain AMGDE01CS-322" /LENGTH=140 /DNA_ID=CAMNT_0051611211 /DNA_START=115 /DNA_END=534 /DNA_ORIENTATION=-